MQNDQNLKIAKRDTPKAKNIIKEMRKSYCRGYFYGLQKYNKDRSIIRKKEREDKISIFVLLRDYHVDINILRLILHYRSLMDKKLNKMEIKTMRKNLGFEIKHCMNLVSFDFPSNICVLNWYSGITDIINKKLDHYQDGELKYQMLAELYDEAIEIVCENARAYIRYKFGKNKLQARFSGRYDAMYYICHFLSYLGIRTGNSSNTIKQFEKIIKENRLTNLFETIFDLQRDRYKLVQAGIVQLESIDLYEMTIENTYAKMITYKY